MKKTKLISFILRLLIGLVLIALLYGHIRWIGQIYEDFKIHQDVEMDFYKTVKAVFYFNYFIAPVLLLFAVIGYFLRNVIGWVFLNTLFYFMVFDMFFIRIPIYSESYSDYFNILIPLTLVIIMNLKAIRQNYRILNERVILYNLVAILTGLLFAYLSGYLHLHHDMSIFEIMDKLK